MKYLGIRLDENLSWNEQYKSLKCKVKCGSSIHKLRDILPQTKFEQVYRALAERHLRFGNELYGTVCLIPNYVVITGDLNCWSSQWWVSDIENNERKLFEPLTSNIGPHQLISEPTH